ncbi:MAG: DNA recombination protein RmuC [Actinomycetota bacterium]
MNTVTLIVLVVLCGLVALNLLRGRTAPTPPSVAVTPAFDPTAVENSVAKTVSAALNDALTKLNDEARKARDETIAMASKSITDASAQELGARSAVIDKTLQSVQNDVMTRLNDLDQTIQRLQQNSAQQYGTMEKVVGLLNQRTESLNVVLTSSQARGQWGERLAEDILRTAGMVEGVNYSKQSTIDGGGRPDYCFSMPPDRVLYMDVKFPLDRYQEYVQAPTDELKKAAQAEFLKAVRGHVNTLSKREYVDKTTDNTVDYVLMFVPNEGISGFIHESDPSMIDFALEKKVVLCSPLALYAYLVVVRQATDSFHTERAAAEIMQFVNLFHKEWDNYTKEVDSVQKAFEGLTDKLASINTGGTRYRKLNAQITKIEKVRKREGVPELAAGEVGADIIDADDFDD